MSCVICLEKEEEIRNSTCKCNVGYCETCLTGWLSVNPTCTTCRCPFVLADNYKHIQEKVKKPSDGDQEITTETLINICRFLIRRSDEEIELMRQDIVSAGGDFNAIIRNIMNVLHTISRTMFDNAFLTLKQDISRDSVIISNYYFSLQSQLEDLVSDMRAKFFPPPKEILIMKKYIDSYEYRFDRSIRKYIST